MRRLQALFVFHPVILGTRLIHFKRNEPPSIFAHARYWIFLSPHKTPARNATSHCNFFSKLQRRRQTETIWCGQVVMGCWWKQSFVVIRMGRVVSLKKHREWGLIIKNSNILEMVVTLSTNWLDASRGSVGFFLIRGHCRAFSCPNLYGTHELVAAGPSRLLDEDCRVSLNERESQKRLHHIIVTWLQIMGRSWYGPAYLGNAGNRLAY